MIVATRQHPLDDVEATMTRTESLLEPRKTTATEKSIPSQRLLRLPDVCQAVGLRPTAIYQLQASGNFPRSVRLTSRSVAWDSGEVALWIAQRLTERDKNKEATTQQRSHSPNDYGSPKSRKRESASKSKRRALSKG